MTGRSRPYHPEGPHVPNRLGLAGLMQYSLSTVADPQPWLGLYIGRDLWSWGIRVFGSTGGVRGAHDPGEDLLYSRWMRDLEGLPAVCLTAQSALRKLSLDRGWPIP